MLEHFNNAVTDKQLDFLINEFESLRSSVDFSDRYFDGQTLMWERVAVNKYNPALRNIVLQMFNSTGANLAATETVFFVRCYNPTAIHVDVDDTSPGHTYMIPLTFNTDIKTVVFKNNTTLAEFKQLISRHSKIPFKPKHNLSETINMDHCWGAKPNIVDVLELDGYAEWTKGSIIKFLRQQIHSSSNFKTLGLEYKDYVLCHSSK